MLHTGRSRCTRTSLQSRLGTPPQRGRKTLWLLMLVSFRRSLAVIEDRNIRGPFYQRTMSWVVFHYNSHGPRNKIIEPHPLLSHRLHAIVSFNPKGLRLSDSGTSSCRCWLRICSVKPFISCTIPSAPGRNL